MASRSYTWKGAGKAHCHPEALRPRGHPGGQYAARARPRSVPSRYARGPRPQPGPTASGVAGGMHGRAAPAARSRPAHPVGSGGRRGVAGRAARSRPCVRTAAKGVMQPRALRESQGWPGRAESAGARRFPRLATRAPRRRGQGRRTATSGRLGRRGTSCAPGATPGPGPRGRRAPRFAHGRAGDARRDGDGPTGDRRCATAYLRSPLTPRCEDAGKITVPRNFRPLRPREDCAAHPPCDGPAPVRVPGGRRLAGSSWCRSGPPPSRSASAERRDVRVPLSLPPQLTWAARGLAVCTPPPHAPSTHAPHAPSTHGPAFAPSARSR
jgi:hypothetical protein